MKCALAALIAAACLLTAQSGFAAEGQKGPDIRIVDGKVSIQADAIPLDRLLHLLDEATGMKSKVSPELASRTFSVRFSDLSFDEAVQKIFEGQSLDYMVIGQQSIVVSKQSQNIAANRGAVPYTPPPPENTFEENPPPFAQPQPGQPVGAPPQPGTVQTPFGPMANPRAGQPGIPGAPQQNPMAPMVAPGQPANTNNNPFNNTGGFGTSTLPTLPSSNPFGTPTRPNP